MSLLKWFHSIGRPSAPAAHDGGHDVLAPVDGEMIALQEVSDPAFSSGALGKGCAFKPVGEVVYAPICGTVSVAGAPNYHAVGITGNDGAELMVHVGVDTVEMNGTGFTVYTKTGAQVRAGEPLLAFSLESIRTTGHDDTVVMVIMNSAEFPDFKLMQTGSVSAGSVVIHLGERMSNT